MPPKIAEKNAAETKETKATAPHARELEAAISSITKVTAKAASCDLATPGRWSKLR